MERVVSILCSGMGLGVYIPSLLLEYQLNRKGIRTEVFVVESYFSDDKLVKLKENKKAFHKSFKVALLGHRMATGNVRPELDMMKVEELLKYWEEKERRDFIVMSGHWPAILEIYIDRVGSENLNLDAVRMDSDVTPSWKNFTNDKDFYNEAWLFDFTKKDLPCRISVNNSEPIAYENRQERFLIHGGGWGMGTYRDKVEQLNGQGLYLDIVAYEHHETEPSFKGNRYFLMDPQWSPWVKNKDGRYDFPPMYAVEEGRGARLLEAKGYQAIFDVCKCCKAIISKPGGGTLVDSLASATPIIFIDPIAKHEQTNALLWETLGLGISYDQWAASGFSMNVLEEIHHNILEKRKQVPDYIDGFVKKYRFEIHESDDQYAG